MPNEVMQFAPAGSAFFVSLASVLLITPLIKVIAVRCGFVAFPSGTRWHQEVTPLLGGTAIFIGICLALALFLPRIWDFRLIGFVLGGFIVFGIGLWDDISSLGPVTKLLGQIVAACAVVASGNLYHTGGHELISVLVTIFWIVAVTNAFNLIDNMDGLSAGTACISGLVITAYSVLTGNLVVAVISASLVGACLGFLRYNFSPASIFMGDCGSMLLGFTLAVTSAMQTSKLNVVATMVVPVLVLGVPIFDTTFVSLTRMLRGQSIAQGGKDHTSHRLVILGLSERQTVLLIYAFSFILGATAFLCAYLNLSIVIVFSILVVAGAVVFGLFLGDVKIDQSDLPAVRKRRPGDHPAVLHTNVLHKRAFLEMLLDLVAVCLAFYTANLLRFEAELDPEHLRLIWISLPIIIPVKLCTLFAFGLYRSMWRYLGFVDLIHMFRAVSASSILVVVAISMIWRFEGYSRTVFVIDWILMLLLVTGQRLMFRGLRETLPGIRKDSGKRALIIGAGDAGEMVVREMLNNPRLGYQPVGFVDDHPGKLGRRMYGVAVMGSRRELRRILIEERIEEVIIAIPSASDENLLDFLVPCSDLGVPCRRTHSMI
jgi:UDP-GlcNAc:undecaprenyl-phosphate GlcNAc-1-phosphate transferase